MRHAEKIGEPYTVKENNYIILSFNPSNHLGKNAFNYLNEYRPIKRMDVIETVLKQFFILNHDKNYIRQRALKLVWELSFLLPEDGTPTWELDDMINEIYHMGQRP